MEVLYLHQHFSTPDGAAGTRSYEFARHLVQEGHTVRMIAGQNARSDLARLAGAARVIDVEGIEVRVVGVPYSNAMGFVARVSAFVRFALGSVVEGLRCPRPDVVFATSTPLTIAIPGILLSLLHRRPLVFEVRDIWPESAVATGVLTNPLFIGLGRLLELAAYRKAARVITLSGRMRDRVVGKGDVPASKVAVVPIGTDLDLFVPADGSGAEPDGDLKRSLGAEGKFVAVFTGAHGRANGLDAVVDAAKLVGDDVVIALIGEGGQKERLKRRAEMEGVERIRFLDGIPKTALAKLLPEADCGLMILEPLDVFSTVLPNKFFDYLSAGLPVVVNFAGEVADHVRAWDAGFHTVTPDGAGIARAITALASDGEGRRRMARNARSLAERYARGRVAGEFAAVLSEVVEGEARAVHGVAPA